MEQYDPAALVQKAQVSESHYNCSEFVQLLTQLSNEDFDKFCQRILNINGTGNSNAGAIGTVDIENIKDPVAAWDAKNMSIDSNYENPDRSE